MKVKFDIPYTNEQITAITEYGKNIIVSAGAGSGKTQVLTERVSYFIKYHGIRLNEFLILTFTNLAAGEMKERIRKKLTKEGLPDALMVDTSYICTFDSFALALVKQYHYLLNLTPNVSIVDSNIISVRKRTIISDLFEELYYKKNEKFLKVIDLFCFKDDEDIQDLVFKLYAKAESSISETFYLNNFIDNYYNEALIKEVINIYLNKLLNIKEELKKLLVNLPDCYLNTKSKDTYYSFVNERFNSFINSESYDELISSFPLELGCKKPSKAPEVDKEVIDEFKKYYDSVVKYISQLPNNTLEFYDYFNKNKEIGKILIDIVKELDKRIKEYKKEYDLFEFSDIAKLALNLLKTKEEVRNSLKSSLKMIMIDEYQDTSEIQETFINLIENNNVYMVGDVKQSIYRFRNARCDIFINKYEEFKYHGKGIAIDLNKNFRSRKEVLDDINYIFKHLMTKEYGGASYIEDHLIEYGNKDYIKKGKLDISSHSDFIIHNDKKNASITEAHLVARDIIDKINNHYQVYDKKGYLRNCKFSDFCILMDRGTAFDDYYKVFTTYQIPLFIDNDENIKDTPLVKVLTNILKVVKALKNKEYYTKEFKKAFISVVRSFMYNLSDDEIYNICKDKSYNETSFIKEVKESLFNSSYLPLSKQIESLIFDLDIYNRLIQSGNIIKNEKYLDLFIGLFNDMTKLNYTLDDFLLYLENIDTYNLKLNLSSTGSTVDSVKLMNIHKSKGLEFSIVYFTGLSKHVNVNELKNDFGISNKYGLILKNESKNKLNIIKDLNKEIELKEAISEYIRLFYVALTRTKEKMIFLLEDEEYNELYETNNLIELTNFINEYQLDDQDRTYTLNKIIDAFVNKKINKEVFISLLNRYNILYPAEFENYSLNKINNLPLDYYLNNFTIQTSLIIPNYIEYEAILRRVTNHYLNKEINLNIYLEFLSLLNYEVNINYLNNLYSIDTLDLNKLIKNLRTTYDDSYNQKFIKNLLNKNTSLNEFLEYNFLYKNSYPNEYEIRNIIIKYEDKKISKEDFNTIINYYGYECIDEDFYKEDFINSFKPNNNIYIYFMDQLTNHRKFDIDVILKLIYQDYLSKKIDEEKFIHLINILNYIPSIDYLALKDDEKEELELSDIYNIIVDNYPLDIDFNNLSSFKDFINPFINKYLFSKRTIDINVSSIAIDLDLNNLISENLVIHNLNIKPKLLDTFRASKKLDSTSSKKAMEFGTKLHFILEMMDFKNPNYDLITDEFFKDIVRSFINSPLLKDICNSKIYKEYEFFDSSTNTSGIIDLMLVYDNHIDIIDYKTKNIDDEFYIKQLNVYKTYITRVFNLPVNIYLYSLLEKTYKNLN